MLLLKLCIGTEYLSRPVLAYTVLISALFTRAEGCSIQVAVVAILFAYEAKIRHFSDSERSHRLAFDKELRKRCSETKYELLATNTTSVIYIKFKRVYIYMYIHTQ